MGPILDVYDDDDLAITFCMQYKNIRLLSDSTDKHSYDSSYSSPMYHTTAKL